MHQGAVVLMPTAVGKIKANVLTSDRKRKCDYDHRWEVGTKSGDEPNRLCHEVHNEFPFGFQYGGNTMHLVVRANNPSLLGSRQGPETTYIFSFIQRGEVMDGSAEVSTKDVPRLMNFKFDVISKEKTSIAELALRAIIWFVKLHCPRESQFDNDVHDRIDRHHLCSKKHLKDFLTKVKLFQRTNKSTELLQDCAPREKVIAFLGKEGQIIQSDI